MSALAGRAQVVSYGGGTNSVAMLVGLAAHGERPDAIVFADTRGEKPNTYGHLLTMQPWCERVGFPSIQIVVGEQPQQVKDGSLEADCLRLAALPSRVFGFGSCADNWKIRPFQRWCAKFLGADYTRLIGFHAGEAHRCAGGRGAIRYPLVEWGWDQERCAQEIERAGLPLPGKSACFFCPSSKLHEIRRLRIDHPNLHARALAMEATWSAVNRRSGDGHVRGLGRSFAWADLEAQAELFADPPEECGEACFT